MKKRKFILLGVAVVLIALLLEAGILNNVNSRNTYQTSQVLLDRVINVLDRNTQSEEELINSLKDDYIVRAKAVAYIIDAKPEAEKDVDELRKIANLMSVDEVHLFDKDGAIYSGSVPKYYGYNFDSGEQLEYFKPMLTDKTLTMCQDVTPNTSEGKEMMYAITWNEAGTRMVQVGIKPVRLLEEVKQNEVSSVVENMPVYEGMSILVADTKTGEIYGATDTDKIGKTLEDIGVDTRDSNLAKIASMKVYVDGKKQKCILRQDDKYVVGVLITSTFNFQNTIIAMLIVGVYLSLATACMIYMLWRIFKTDKEKELLMYRSHTDELTGCFNRHAYEEDIAQLRMDEAFVYISLDLNGLKTVNDSLGHAAGDEVIRGVAFCMKQCFAEIGKVYRIGGDEFVIIVLNQIQNIENIRETFDKAVRRWQGKMVKEMSVSCGYVSSDEKEWDTIYDIAKAADARMYENKAAYYQKSGRDRRK